MTDGRSGDPRAEHGSGDGGSRDTAPGSPEPVLEELDEAECFWLISRYEVGRIAYSGRFGPTVLPVNYRLHEGTILFRTAVGSPMDADLRTGISDAEYKVAFEVDEVDAKLREGWSVLIQGSAHHVDSQSEREALRHVGVEPWPGGERELFIRIIPTRVTGRRIRRAAPPAPG